MKHLFALALLVSSLPSFASEVTEESYLNCDDRAQYIRIALDPVAQRIWFVRLDERGQPERRLPEELRVTEGFVDDVSAASCRDCFKFHFRLQQGGSALMYGVTSWRGRSLVVDLFEVTDPSDPEQTWNSIPCWVKR